MDYSRVSLMCSIKRGSRHEPASRITSHDLRRPYDQIEKGGSRDPAGAVAVETGLTPRQLLGQRDELLEALQASKATLMHDVPGDCWSSGPSQGDSTHDLIADLVVCPSCLAIREIDHALAAAERGPPCET